MNSEKSRSFFKRNRWRLLLVVVIAGAIGAFYALGFEHYLSLDYLRESESSLKHLYEMRPFLWAVGYFGIYVAVTGLSLPLATVITLLAGPVFGLLRGSVIVTFAAATGATLAFLVARFVLRDWVQSHLEKQLDKINRGVERDGIYYLFLLRLIPAFPFFVINLAMGLTPMRVRAYFLVSLVGMIPGNVLYVNAGVQLGKIQSLSDLLSPGLIASFVALGVFPLIVKKVVDFWRKRHGEHHHPRHQL